MSGRVGTGWSNRDASALLEALASIETAAPPLPWPKRPPARWCRPIVKARIRYLGRDRAAHLRHASFRVAA